MAYFDKDFLAFFYELDQNNNKPWFDKNKPRYEKSVKKPWEQFVQAIIDLVQEDDKHILITYKEAIFRIYKDVRFSVDKTPYKNHVSAVISRGGRKDKTTPGLYLQANHDGLSVYGGCYYLEKDQLTKIRESIAENLIAFDKILSDKAFQKSYGKLHGEQYKRIPPEFAEAAEKQPLLYNKQFYYYTKIPAKSLTSNDLPDQVMEHYFSGKKMKDFLTKALLG